MALSVSNINPDNPLAQGLALLRAGDHQRAVRLLRMARSADSGHLPTIRALATAHLRQCDPVAARRVLASFLLEHPLSEAGWLLAARLEWKLGQYDQALAQCRRGLAAMPQSAALRRQIRIYQAVRGGQGADPAVPPHRPSPDAMSDADGDYLERVARETAALEGLLNLPAGDDDTPMFREIAARLAALLEAQPLHADRQLLMARLQLRIGNLPAATRAVQRALRANPQYDRAHRLRAILLARAGDYEQATRTLQALIARGRDWPDLHVLIAQWQHARGRNDQARQHLYSALRLNPRYARASALLQRCAA